MNHIKVKIKEPWWGAFKKFGWPQGTWGVGLNKREVDAAATQNKMLDIHIWKFKGIFYVPAREVQAYAKEKNTMYTAKAGTRLYVVPSSILGDINDHQQETGTPVHQ